jgi:8-oxo-dGTP diphosphatase
MSHDNYERPMVTVDAVVLGLREGRLEVLLARRPIDSPYAPGKWALPGGFVHTDTDRDDVDAVLRVLKDKAGAQARHLEQLRTFAGAKRDSRGWSVSIAYLAIVDTLVENDKQARFFPIDKLPALPFDHRKIIAEATQRVRNKASYSSLPSFFLPETFTLPQMQAVYEIVLGSPLNPAAFRRKVMDQGLVEACKQAPERGGQKGRPAQLYRLAQAQLQDLGRAMLGPGPTR